jgi:hypothetical protein
MNEEKHEMCDKCKKLMLEMWEVYEKRHSSVKTRKLINYIAELKEKKVCQECHVTLGEAPYDKVIECPTCHKILCEQCMDYKEHECNGEWV